MNNTAKPAITEITLESLMQTMKELRAATHPRMEIQIGKDETRAFSETPRSGLLCHNITKRSSLGNGKDVRNAARTTLNIAVFAPIPKARVSPTRIVEEGLLPSVRMAYRRSSQTLILPLA